MQEDFKNQLQNSLGIWRKRGQVALDQILKEAKDEIRNRLSQQGVAERWPALVNVIEEFLPDVAPTVAGIIGRRAEPMADWLGATVKNWQPYKIELAVAPQRHLVDQYTWLTSSLNSMAELAGRWLIEKHCPPGDLKIRVLKSEVDVIGTQLTDCTVRCELDSSEFELLMSELMKNRIVELPISAMILSSNDVLLSQVHFNFEISWAPLLK